MISEFEDNEDLFNPENIYLPRGSPSGGINFLGWINLYVSLQTEQSMHIFLLSNRTRPWLDKLIKIGPLLLALNVVFLFYLQNETIIADQLMKIGPLSIALNAELLQFYHHGIFEPPSFLCNPKNLDHGKLSNCMPPFIIGHVLVHLFVCLSHIF